MARRRPLLRVGLTGGIASGKTTVAHILEELGAFVVDADHLTHELLEPAGACHGAVVARFGRGILDPENRIVRARLARAVFQDASARRDLNAILHPVIRAEAERRMDAYADEGCSHVAVFDAALLVETGAYRRFDRLVVVSCRPESQLRRLIGRDGMTRAEAEARLRAQSPIQDKLAVADYVVETEGTLRETRRQAERVYASLLEDFESRYGDRG